MSEDTVAAFKYVSMCESLDTKETLNNVYSSGVPMDGERAILGGRASAKRGGEGAIDRGSADGNEEGGGTRNGPSGLVTADMTSFTAANDHVLQIAEGSGSQSSCIRRAGA